MKSIDLILLVFVVIFAVSVLLFIFSMSVPQAAFRGQMMVFLLLSTALLFVSAFIRDSFYPKQKQIKPAYHPLPSTINLTNHTQLLSHEVNVSIEKERPLKNQNFKWITQWKDVKNLDFSLEQDHFFLERRYLDDFSKELISHAKSNVLIANPFIQHCDLSNTLREAIKNGVKVQIITRRPNDENPEYLEKRKNYHSTLIHEGIALFYDEQVHAKIIIADHEAAIVSSMNFFATSSAGASWEAGLVTINPSVVESISNSFSKVLSDIANNASISHDTGLKASAATSKLPPDIKSNSTPANWTKQKHVRAYEVWTTEEDSRIIEEYNKGIKISALAQIHQRERGAIRARLSKLGLLK